MNFIAFINKELDISILQLRKFFQFRIFSNDKMKHFNQKSNKNKMKNKSYPRHFRATEYEVRICISHLINNFTFNIQRTLKLLKFSSFEQKIRFFIFVFSISTWKLNFIFVP